MQEILIQIFGFTIIFVATTLGAATVFIFKKDIPAKFNTLLLGFAAGVMIAAAVWSLLIPSMEQSKDLGWKDASFVPAAVGFIIGGLLLLLIDKIVPHTHKTGLVEGPKTAKLSKNSKMFLAVTIHNVPEGLAVGVAFGVAQTIGGLPAYMAALGLALGIAIQNFPEGAAVSLPMKSELGNTKAFLYGTASGAVEPVAALIGFFLSILLTAIQPWLLGLAAGAMIFVVVEDIIPDAQLDSHSHLGTWGIMIGFVIMMSLDILFG